MEPEAVITAVRIHEIMAAIRPNAPPVDRLAKEGCVEGAIGNAVIAARYAQESDEPDALLIAAYLLRSPVNNHCFMDGNKRIARLACLEVLAVHALATIEADQDEAAAFVEGVVGQANVAPIVEWLAIHLAPLGPSAAGSIKDGA